MSSIHSHTVTVSITKHTLKNTTAEGSHQNGGLKLLTLSNNNDACCEHIMQ